MGAVRAADDTRDVTGASHPPASRSVISLIEQARSILMSAAVAPSAAERFRLAHLAALRTAAALFAYRVRPGLGKRRLVSAWVLVESAAPELADWAAYFAGTAAKRAAVEAGAVSVVSSRDADDQLHAAEQFLVLVEQAIGFLAAPLAS